MHKRQNPISKNDWQRLSENIKEWGISLGFQQVGITDTQLSEHEAHLKEWLNQGRHGEMAYMAQHGNKRSRPAELIENTITVISVRMDYMTDAGEEAIELLDKPDMAYISRYALGRDYHKLLRKRLQQLAKKMEEEIGQFGYRVFCDSAPVLEKPLSQKAGLGWIGKHTNLINKKSGSWFFLGEIYTDLPLPLDKEEDNHCGSCHICMEVCPSQAITGPYSLDARRCISYLTIELQGSIPLEFRQAIGNRIYGCDDCQLFCPWNRFAVPSSEAGFVARHNLDSATLLDLFSWSEEEFLQKTEGSAIRRLGYARWIRNIAIALGNCSFSEKVVKALEGKQTGSAVIQEHLDWALERQAQQTKEN